MAIAKNFLKFPHAMALQWPLPLKNAKPLPLLLPEAQPAPPRPKKYQGRGFRTLLSRAAKVAARRAARIMAQRTTRTLGAMIFAAKLERAGATKKPVPQWFKDARSRAKALAKAVKDALLMLDFLEITTAVSRVHLTQEELQ